MAHGAATVTNEVQVEVQPNLVVWSVMVKDPAIEALTLTVDPVSKPTMDPFPDIDQAWVTLSDGFTVLV